MPPIETLIAAALVDFSTNTTAYSRYRVLCNGGSPNPGLRSFQLFT